MQRTGKNEILKAFQIGTICIFSYIVSYYMRNLLSVTSPEILSCGYATKEFLASLSSIYMAMYAIGQLINGVIGDIVKPKLMIVFGTAFSGIASSLFALTNSPIIKMVLFAVIGFSLSMLRGPLVKTISENTMPKHSRIICTFFSFASFAGPLIASLFSILFDWKKTFLIGGIIALIIGCAVYVVFTLFERNKKITYSYSKNSNGFKNIFKVFTLNHFVFYVFIGALAEISAASINFWIPTYLTEQLSFSENTSKIIYSAMSFIKSITPFISLFFFTLLKEKDIKMCRLTFIFATAFFIGMRFIDNPILNIICLLFAQIAIGCASALLWSIYIPSQSESGMVSTINGVLDFSGYIFASVANLIFAHTINNFGWNEIILVWAFMCAMGFAVSLIAKDKH